MTPGPGRPRSPNPRDKVRSVHLTADELALIEKAANGKPTTAYIRDAAIERAKVDLRKAAAKRTR